MEKRKELISAAKAGVREFLGTTRGAAMFGPTVKVIDCGERGFAVVHHDDERVYFDVTEI